MDDASINRLASVNPVLADRVYKLSKSLNFEIHVTQGIRAPDEQRAYYAQGRLGLMAVNNMRKKVGLGALTNSENVTVTDAPPYHSWHEYGLAVDVVPLTPVPNWNEEHPDWKTIVNAARQIDLLDGISFHGEVHLQPVEISVSPTPLYISMLQQEATLVSIWKHTGLLPEETK